MAAWPEIMQVDNNTGDSVSTSTAAPDMNGNGPMDYKTMLVVIKNYAKECDAMIDKVSTINAKFADQLSKLTTIIDPEVNAILYKKIKDLPDFSLSQQRSLKLESAEIDKRHAELCDMLDEHVAETYGSQ